MGNCCAGSRDATPAISAHSNSPRILKPPSTKPTTSPGQIPLPSPRKQQSRPVFSPSLHSHLPIKPLAGSIWEIFAPCQVVSRTKLREVCMVKHRLTQEERVLSMLKKLKRIRGVGKSSADKLRREVELISRLDHPNILKLYEIYEDRDYYYLVSELITGSHLIDYLLANKTHISERLAAKIITQVLKSLHYLHTNGTVHGSLHLKSLLLQSTSPSEEVHVVVMGMGSMAAMSTEEILGLDRESIHYIAPETVQYDSTEKSDVWSCGVMMHVLLCGYPPFSGNRNQEIVQKITQETVVFPQDRWDRVSSEAIQLLRGMLGRDPQTRLSVSECLSHPWLLSHQTSTNPLSSKPLFQALRNLKFFEAKQQLKQALLSYISSHIDSQEHAQFLRTAFLAVDKNGDGLLSRDELIAIYRQKMTLDEATLVADKILHDVDLNHSGCIDYSEFMLAARDYKIIVTSANLKTIFQKFDTEKNGKIDLSAFNSELVSFNFQSSPEIWSEILSESGIKDKSELNFLEFCKVVTTAVGINTIVQKEKAVSS